MQIVIHYEAQARRAAGIKSETIELDGPCRVSDCVRHVAGVHGDTLRPILLGDDGAVQPTLLIFRGDDQIANPDDVELTDGDALTIMTPISGG